MDAYDHDLLARFRTRRDEDAFRQLVRRHLGMIYAVSYRVTGSREQADEIAQSTFARLADTSVGITRKTALAGWLYQTARHLALSAIRSDARRRQREQIAAAMNLNEPSPNVVAEYLEPVMEQLAPDDRDALLLRFFEDRSLRQVGQELGLSEDAARMRVNRALEKMRGVFAKLGITGTAAWLGTTLTTSATASVPAGLGATITTAVLGGPAVAAATTALITETTATTTMNLFNLKNAAAIVATAAVTGTTTYFVQEREAGRLRAENASINETHAKLMSDRQEAMALVQLRDEQIERLRKEVADLPRLRGEVDGLRRKNLEVIENARLLAAAVNPKAVDENAALTEAIEIAREAHEKRQNLFQNRQIIVKGAYASMLHQALMAVAEANGGRYPDNVHAAFEHLGSKMYHEGLEIDDKSISATDFEIVYRGSIQGIQDRENTALFREAIPFGIGGGKAVRVVYFANGRGENVEETLLPSGELEVKRPRDPSADYE